MNSLTKFIASNLSTLSTTTTLSKAEATETSIFAQYEVVENEVLSNSNLKGLSISGSLFSLTTFKSVTFESCVFYASKMENCEFINCKFVNCSFEFGEISLCNFKSTTFVDCLWEMNPIKKSQFVNCGLDRKSAHFISKEDNEVTGCYSLESARWMAASESEAESLNPMGVFLSHFKKKLAA